MVVAGWGLIDVYLVPLQWWRDSGAPGWFQEQLGLEYACFGGLPENWIFNTGDESNPIRRLVSTFLSPLASAYFLVVVLLFIAAARRRRLTLAVGALAYVGLLCDAHAGRAGRADARADRDRGDQAALGAGGARARIARRVGGGGGGVSDDRAFDLLHRSGAGLPER